MIEADAMCTQEDKLQGIRKISLSSNIIQEKPIDQHKVANLTNKVSRNHFQPKKQLPECS